MPGWRGMLHFCLPPLQSYVGWVSINLNLTGFSSGTPVFHPLQNLLPVKTSGLGAMLWDRAWPFSSSHWGTFHMHLADPVELRPSQFSPLAASKGDQQLIVSDTISFCMMISRIMSSKYVWNSSFSLSHYQTVKVGLTCYRLSTDDMMDPG